MASSARVEPPSNNCSQPRVHPFACPRLAPSTQAPLRGLPCSQAPLPLSTKPTPSSSQRCLRYDCHPVSMQTPHPILATCPPRKECRTINTHDSQTCTHHHHHQDLAEKETGDRTSNVTSQVRLVVADAVAGLVIGKRGENVRAIAQDSGANGACLAPPPPHLWTRLTLPPSNHPHQSSCLQRTHRPTMSESSPSLVCAMPASTPPKWCGRCC